MKPSDFKNIEFVNPTDPFTATGIDRYRMDEVGVWPSSQTQCYLLTKEQIAERYPDTIFPEGKEPKFKIKKPVSWPRIPRKLKGEFYIPGNRQKTLGKGLYEQMNSKGKLVRYSKNIDLSWMKPVIWKFTAIGKKTTNLINKLYGHRKMERHKRF